MNNDPNQPQQPPYGHPPSPYGSSQSPYGQPPPSYGQPPPSYGQPQPPYGPSQSPYGQPPPPSSYEGPPPSSSVPPQQLKKRPRWPLIVGIVVVLLLLACGGTAFAVVNFISHNPAADAVNQYYTAIQNQSYATAFGYLDPNMTLTTSQGPGQQITQDLFTQVGQDFDTQKGKVSKYNITGTELSSSNGVNTGKFTVSVTRSGAPYDVHLGLRQEGNGWKIISFDSL